MADPSRYFVDPDSNETVVLGESELPAAAKWGFKPATTQQIAEYDAKDTAIKEAQRSPVLTTVKAAALEAAELASPINLTRSVLALGAQPEAVTSYLAEKLLPESVARGFKAAEVYSRAQETAQPGIRTALQAASDVLAPVTPTGALIKSGLMTPEQIIANQAEAGMTGQFLGLAGAVLAPATLARTALSGAAKGAAALALEEEAGLAKFFATKLSQEGAPAASAAIKASEEAAAKVSAAVDAAAARRALLAKVPGGEKVARGVEKALALPEATSALRLINESVGRPVAQAAERSARTLIDKAPALGSAPQVVKDIVAKSIANGAGSAADLALLGLAGASQEAVLGDHRIVAERALASMEEGAIEGFKFGAALGAVPPVLGAGISGLGKAVRGLDRTFNKLFPGVSSAFTGAEVESIEALREARGDIRNAGEILARRMAEREPLPPEPAPFVPGVEPAPFTPMERPMVGVEGVGMVPISKAPGMGEMLPVEPIPRPADLIKPKPLGFVEPTLPKVDVDVAAESLFKELKLADESAQATMHELNKFIRPVEESRLFDQYQKFKYDKALSEVKTLLKGRTATAADQKTFKNIVEMLDDVPRNEGMRLADYVRQVATRTLKEFPDAVPSGTIKQMYFLADKLQKQSAKDVPVVKTYQTINSVKRQLADLSPSYEQGEIVSQVEAKARRAARAAVKEFIRSTESEDIWGPNAVRQSRVNDARMRMTIANKNVKRLLGRKEDIGIEESKRAFSSRSIASFVENPADLANADKLEALNEWRAALENLHEQASESAKMYPGKTNVENFGSSLGRLANAYTDAENVALRKIDVEYAKQEAVKMKAEVRKFNEELKAEFEARKLERDRLVEEIEAAEASRNKARESLQAKVEQLEGERKLKAQADLALLDREEAVAKEQAKARLREFKAREAEAQKLSNERRAKWEQTLQQRKDEVAKQVRLMQTGAKMNDLNGAIIMYEAFSHPVLAGIAAAAKNPVLTYKVLGSLEKAAKYTEAKANSFVDFLDRGQTSSLSVMKPSFVAMTVNQERNEYNRRVQKIRALADDVDELTSHLQRGVDEIESAAPKIAEHTRSVQAQAIGMVADAIPEPPPGLPPYQAASWEPTDAQVREWNRYYESVANPSAVIYRMAQGSATQKEIDMVNAVYGNMMNDLRAKVIERLKKSPNMPAPRRAVLSKMFGIDMDGAPKLGVVAQSVYAPPAPPQMPAKQRAIPVSRIEKMNVSGRAGKDTADFREAQRGAHLR